MFSKLNRGSRLVRRSSGDYQRLEPRQLLAGNVMVNVSDNGNIYIRGDSSDNQIEIVGEVNSTQIEIAGINGTTINGKLDSIIVEASKNSASFGSIASVETDYGLRANFGEGDDSVLVFGVEFKGKSLIYGGPGDDSVGLHRAEFPNDITIQTFRGDDSIGIGNSILRGETRLFSLDGADTIGFDQTSFYGKTLVVTGNDNDVVGTDRSLFVGETLVLTQNGNDFVSVGSDTGFDTDAIKTQPKRIYLGEGRDEVVATEELISSFPVVIAGQNGNDSIQAMVQDSPGNSVSVRGFEQSSVSNADSRVDGLYRALVADRSLVADIPELAASIPQLSTLSSALEQAGLDDDSLVSRKATFFAPTDSAFASLEEDTLDSFSAEQLRELLDYHRLPIGEEFGLFERDLRDRSEVDTVSGQAVSIDLSNGELVLNGDARFVFQDFRTKSGVVHLIDRVLSPTSD